MVIAKVPRYLTLGMFVVSQRILRGVSESRATSSD